MKINGTIELYVNVFRGNSLALSTSVVGKNAKSEKSEGEWTKKYISVYLSRDFENREKVIAKLTDTKKGYYYNCELEEAYLMPKTLQDGTTDICIVISKCKFGKPIEFGNKSKSTKTKSKVDDDDLPF